MRYTKKQKLDIGKKIYEGELNKFEAADKYNIDYNIAKDYMRMYCAENRLPIKNNMPAACVKSIMSNTPTN